MKSLMMASGPSPQPSASPPIFDGRALKKEASDDEMKDFAETAMNEVLGWYGYDSRRGPDGRGPMGIRTVSPSPSGQPAGCRSPSDDPDECSWCKNPIPPEANALSQSIGDRYCSELCFSQSRRATFKRAKTCDWCRHVRHTVSYVDFQDGATQLQFCSDKCLNQYKMHIFCRETQAHLNLNPHLVNVTASSSTSLITPDLWMKNCRSRSVSPSSDRSVTPPTENTPKAISPKNNTVVITPPPLPSSTQISHKQLPVISVAPNSKLMKNKMPNIDERQQTLAECRREHRIMKTNTKKRRSSRCASAVAPQIAQKHNSVPIINKPQDLRITSPVSQDGSPNTSTLLPNNLPPNIVSSPPTILHPRLPNMNPVNFPNPLLNLHPNHFFGNGQPMPQDPRIVRPPFIPPPNFVPHPPPLFNPEQLRPPAPPQLGMGLPSVTVVVPYPIFLPMPLPIPVPIPILEFSKALNAKRWQTSNDSQKSHSEDNESDQPLDYTTYQKKTQDMNETMKRENKVIERDVINESDEPPVNIPDDNEALNPEQKLPKFKITRLGTKLSRVVQKSRECSDAARPLRKRSRLVDAHSDEECNPVVNKTRKPVHA